MTVELTNVRRAHHDGIRGGTGGLTADELVELGVRSLLLGEQIPRELGMLASMTEPGIGVEDLRQAFDLPNEFAESIARLVIAEGLIGSGNAGRLVDFGLGPRTGRSRHVALEWEDAGTYAEVDPARRRVEGEWRAP